MGVEGELQVEVAAGDAGARGEGLLHSVGIVVGGVLAVEGVPGGFLMTLAAGALEDQLVLVGGQVQARQVDRQDAPVAVFEYESLPDRLKGHVVGVAEDAVAARADEHDRLGS